MTGQVFKIKGSLGYNSETIRKLAYMTEKEKWEIIGEIFDNKRGCFSCPNYKKFDTYDGEGKHSSSTYCIILADLHRNPEECPEFNRKS